MYKLFLTFLFTASLSAQINDGIAMVVENQPVTLYDIEKEMEISKVDGKTATDILIRKALEKVEIEKRHITISSDEVYEEIKKTAARNNMSVSDFYDAIRESNGLSSTELKKQMKLKLESQKLYSSIAYSAMNEPSQSDIQEYYELHKDDFSHPSSFDVIIYQSQDKSRLEEKINNPMFYSPDIATNEQQLPYDKISPELASLLESTPLNSFTPVIPDGKGGAMSFYIKTINSAQNSTIESMSDQIKNKIMADKREQVLGDHFARLRHNADIKIIRDIK